MSDMTGSIRNMTQYGINIYICENITHMWYDSFEWHDTYVIWLTSLSDMTHMWHDSLVRVTWLICDMTHMWYDSLEWHNSYVTWLTSLIDIPCSYALRDLVQDQSICTARYKHIHTYTNTRCVCVCVYVCMCLYLAESEFPFDGFQGCRIFSGNYHTSTHNKGHAWVWHSLLVFR